MVSEEMIFSHIHAGDRIFIGTGCGEPQYLVKKLAAYVEENPKAFYDTEIIHVWTLGVAPYTYDKFKYNFRHNSFFIGHNTRDAVNRGDADYTPIFLSDVPELFRRGLVTVDVALIQTSPPDDHGYMSLGVSADTVKAALEKASLVIAQINARMPRVHGDTFIHIGDIDYAVIHDEELLEYNTFAPKEIVQRIGQNVSRIIEDGDTIQVGYGSIPNAILSCLDGKKHLGIHTEMLGDGIVALMKKGVVDNTQKTINRGKTIASFCMANRATYDYIHDNPGIEFRTIDYTNNPLIIAQHHKMIAINSALEVDLTGQSTAESIGNSFYSGIGGQSDFMRGAALAPGGKPILVLQSTTTDGRISRIIPSIKEGAGVTLTRGDIHYVVTEYGIAYLHGKNIRERAMSLITIAHPKFRSWLIEEAKKRNLIYRDQAFITGKEGEYPQELETYRTIKDNKTIMFRPVKISDEPLIKNFFYSLSDTTMYRRFLSVRRDISHQELQRSFVVIDYTRGMVLLAVMEKDGVELIAGLAQYQIIEGTLDADVSIVVRDDFQNQGIGSALLSYITQVAKKQGLLGFTADILHDNAAVMRLIEKVGFKVGKKLEGGVYTVRAEL
ncbi:MAG: GNAT family N-acetyltransferase [Dethiobacteria bacterium]